MFQKYVVFKVAQVNFMLKVSWECWGLHSRQSPGLPPLLPGFNSKSWHHMWVQCVVGSHPWFSGFSPGPPVFLPLQKPKFQIPIQSGNSGQEEQTSRMPIAKLFIYYLLSIVYLFIYNLCA